MRETLAISVVVLALLYPTIASATSVHTPSFQEEISCLPQRIGRVRLLRSEPLFLGGSPCGLLQTVDVIESYRGPAGQLTFFTEEEAFTDRTSDYFLVAFKWPHKVPQPIACYNENMEEVECKPHEPTTRELCLAGRADWAAVNAQRFFRLIRMPPETRIPGLWVAEDRDSILKFLMHVRTVEIPPEGGSGFVRKAFLLEDLRRVIEETAEDACR